MTELDDPRRRPRYTLGELCRYTRVPRATLRGWLAAGLLAPAAPETDAPFSFLNLVEAHVLQAMRRAHRVRMGQIRAALAWLRKSHPCAHPLAELDLETDGRELFVRSLGVPVSASAGGQAAFPQVVDLHLQRIERDERRHPARFYPVTGDGSQRLVVIDPAVADGRPVVQGTALTAAALLARFRAGEAVADLARSCRLPPVAVEEALRCELDGRS